MAAPGVSVSDHGAAYGGPPWATHDLVARGVRGATHRVPTGAADALFVHRRDLWQTYWDNGR
eukprot:221420-Pyramimonas_sp.AAC.1